MDIATKLTDLQTDLQECRRAITYRGGEISATAGFKEVAEKIVSIPASSSIGTVVDENTSALKVVPSNSTKYCYLKSIGGYTHVVPDDNTELAPIRLENAKPTAIKVHGANLIPFPYSSGGVGFTQTKGGITFTINADRSFTVKGTAAGTPSFVLAENLNLPTDVDYYLSGNLISGTWGDGVFVYTNNYSNSTNTTPIVKCPADKKVDWISVLISSGTTVDATFKPMLSAGVAVPYSDYKSPTTYTLPESITSLLNLGLGMYDYEYNEVGLVNEKYSRRYGTKTFVGTETFTQSDLGSRKRFQIKAPTDERYWGGSRPSILKADYLNVDKTAGEINNNDTLKNYILSYQGNWFFYVDGTIFPDLATWQAYLTEHPLEVVYELYEKEITDIDISDFNPLIEVEAGGSIEFITDSGYAPNSTVIYQTIV